MHCTVWLEEMDTSRVGGVLSTDIVLESDTLSTCTNALPARSVPSMVKLTSPASSCESTVCTHVQLVPAPAEASVTTAAAAAVGTPPGRKTQVGEAANASLEANVTVIVSPLPAASSATLLDAIDTALKVGTVLSTAMVLESVVLDT